MTIIILVAFAFAACSPPAQIPPTPAALKTPQSVVIAEAPKPPPTPREDQVRAPLPPLEPAPISFLQQRVTNLYDLALLPLMENTVTTQFTSRNWIFPEHYFDYFIDDGNFTGDKYGWIDEDGSRKAYRIVTGTDGKPEYEVVPRVQGPGSIERIWFAYQQHESINNAQDMSKNEEWLTWGNLGAMGNVRFYFDDELAPRLDLPIKDVFRGTARFPEPLALYYAKANGGNINYLPIPFQKSIRVTTTGRPRLQQIQVKRFLTDPASNRATSASAALAAARSNPADALRSYAPDLTANERAALNEAANAWQACAAKISGESKSYALTIAKNTSAALEFNTPATISSLRVRIPRGMDDSVWMRIFWDGEKEQSLSMPLRGMFGTAERLLPYRALPMGIAQTEKEVIFYSNLPLPFQSARIVFQNERAETLPLTLEVTTRATTPGTEGARLHAFYGSRRMIRREDDGDNYVLVDAKARGKFVGMIFNAWDLDRSALNGPLDPNWRFPYLESNLDVWIDGRLALPGTGIEDDFNASYYYVFAGARNYPTTYCLAGLTLLDYSAQAEPSSQYRFYLNDAPEFREHLRVEAQHGNKRNNLSITYSSTAFWYETR